MNKSKLICASACSAILTTIFVAVITIWAEFSVPFKDWLKIFSGHHWTSKSILSFLLFIIAGIVIYLLPNAKVEAKLKKTLTTLFVFICLGVVAITLFFTGHHFKIF